MSLPDLLPVAFGPADLGVDQCVLNSRPWQLNGPDCAEDPLVAMVPSTDGVLVFTGTPVFTEAPDSELWRVRYDVTPPQAERLDALPGLADLLAVGPVVTAVRGPDDRIWVSVGGQTATGMPKHEVWVGTEQGGFAPLPVQRTYSTEWMWWLVADQGPRGPRLWALTDYGSVDRYEEATGTWTRLAGPTDQPTQTTCVSGRRHCGGSTPRGRWARSGCRWPW